jgi:hypothetical protein
MVVDDDDDDRRRIRRRSKLVEVELGVSRPTSREPLWLGRGCAIGGARDDGFHVSSGRNFSVGGKVAL